MLQGQAVSFEELTAPWSKGSVLILIEMLDSQLCDQMDNALKIIKGLKLNSECDKWIFDKLLQQKYLLMRDELSPDNKEQAAQVIDFFRQKKLQAAAKAYLFIDEELIEHSMDNLSSSWDVIKDLNFKK